MLTGGLFRRQKPRLLKKCWRLCPRNRINNIWRAQAMEDGKENLDEDGQPRGMPPSSEPAESPEAVSDEPGGSVDSAVSRLVDLLYFSQVRVKRCCRLGPGWGCRMSRCLERGI